jgi:signal-transduction protein with cAMP-binding, CBS, and nucleotidyltransferase domain
MLSVERVKELLKDKNISDKEAEEIRDDFHNFAEIIFNKWMGEREKAKKQNTVSGTFSCFKPSCIIISWVVRLVLT